MRPFYRKMSRMLLLLLIFAAVVPFVYPLKNGKPLLSLDQLNLPSLPDISLPDISLPEVSSPSGPSGNESAPVTAYKWRDAGGNWQFGGEPPQGVPYETVVLDPNANLIQGVKPAPEVPPEKPQQTEEASPTGDGEVVFGYTPEKIEAMMEKTREVRDSMEKHYQTLEGMEK